MTNLVLLLLLLPMMEPMLFKEAPFNAIDKIYSICRIAAGLMLFFFIVNRRRMPQSLLVFVVLYQLWIFISTITFNYSGFFAYAGPALSALSVCALFDIFRNKIPIVLKMIQKILLVYIVINIVVVAICLSTGSEQMGLAQFDPRIGDCTYFLGRDNRFVFYFLAAIACTVALNAYKGIVWDDKLVFILIQGMAILVFLDAVGGAIGMGLVSLLMVVVANAKRFPFGSAWVCIGVATAIAAVIIIVCITGNGDALYSLAERLFGKGEGLASRVRIWEGALSAFELRPVQGIGSQGMAILSSYLRNYQFVFNHAHNVWIDTLMRGGVVGIALFYAMMLTASARVQKLGKQSPHARMMVVVLFTCLILDLADSFTDVNFYMILAIMYSFRNMSIVESTVTFQMVQR